MADRPPKETKEFPMTDLSAQFEKISDKAKSATDELKAAAHETRDQLETDIGSARDRATAATEQLKRKADAARDDASSQWREIRDSWHDHVAKARARVQTAGDRLSAHQAERDAEFAETYAYDAIAFALDAIDEAEVATMDALYARAIAAELRV
jgi:predicted  nucleic acid-binding Zn-ribbon protein